jgi:hypothetical protein
MKMFIEKEVTFKKKDSNVSGGTISSMATIVELAVAQ